MINDPKAWFSLAVGHSFNELMWDVADKGILRKFSSASYSANFPRLSSGGCSKLSCISSHPHRSYSINLNNADTFLHKSSYFHTTFTRAHVCVPCSCILNMWLKLFRAISCVNEKQCIIRTLFSCDVVAADFLLLLCSYWYIFAGAFWGAFLA